jgi:hypothetical protein
VDEIQGSKSDDNRVQEFIEKAEMLKTDPKHEHLIISSMTPWCVGDDPVDWEYYDPRAAPLIDFRSYSGWALDKRLSVYDFEDLSLDMEANPDVLFGLYYNQHPAYSKIRFQRIAAGIYFWNSPLSNYGTWTYQFWTGEPLNDLDGSSGDKFLAYPHPDDGSPMPSLNWEAFREGVDDVRYLSSLEHLVQSSPNNDSSLLKQATSLLDEIRHKAASYGPHFRGIYAYMSSEELQEIRKKLLNTLNKFYK